MFIDLFVILGNVCGYNTIKWVPLKFGDKLPHKNILVDISDDYLVSDAFVGRARHFDEILPAKIFANGTALISCCNKQIFKDHFEILTTLDGCEWKPYSDYNIDETAIRVGTNWNKEPIYVGLTYNNNYDKKDYASIYLTSLKTERWNEWNSNGYIDTYSNRDYYRPAENKIKYLSCPTENKWVDASPVKLPNNTVSGDKSEEDYPIYVARLKRGCEIVTGQAVPEIGTATALLSNGEQIEVDYCQVLVGEANEYAWVVANDGEIPDYAVVNGKSGVELSYIARINKTIGHLTHSDAFLKKLDYEILVWKHS